MNTIENPRERRIVEDISAMLTEECVRLGKRRLYDAIAYPPEYVRWNYTSERPRDFDDYVMNGAMRTDAIPDWASKRAVLEFFREEFADSYDIWRGRNADE